MKTLIYLKDAECDWRILQSHVQNANYYKDNKETE